MNTGQLLEQRQSTHGDFESNARISQRLKQLIRVECKDYETLHQVYKESLDMICLKLSRIMSGQPTFKEHWDDIAGYATLAAKQCDAPKPGGVTYVRDVRGNL